VSLDNGDEAAVCACRSQSCIVMVFVHLQCQIGCFGGSQHCCPRQHLRSARNCCAAMLLYPS
jgi:hypothetical protein